ncbi:MULTISPECIES: glycolate oxidase subunit GlcE [Hydrogenophaga]|uniref:FAD linked oxidase domain-containing protein n=1 Tax=Hydrogenophaga intermedia TaxID=65786 RepID=A0A1L1PL11_HYDIT|nr:MULTISPECIES: glycolate oxidase subunit GlcE [Hydrogenophaga]AOS81395.1 glycolate oxidase subunit GlcE [Hydrogenophaga sp. PBC]TMU74145.1 glycolate oxidase subunit GlcE [Hydrogenophaga intermedia]CDN87627.1 FAD linked oxidase domain-containing protein [Hydrogenophaga intermedia]
MPAPHVASSAEPAFVPASDHPAELIDRVRAAAAARTPLRLVGGGTKAFVHAPVAGAPLDLRAHSGILNHEPSELVVTVRAGTPLAELEAALAEHGQCLPFEPPRFGAGGTVGGAVASGLAGPARASVGGARDYVLGARLVNGRGELLTFGGQVMKNVAGYDVSRALAGSWGALGLITELSLKVLPVAPAEATLVFEVDQFNALERLHRWGGQPLPINASRWLRDTGAGKERLFLRLRGAAAAVEAACERLLAEASGARLNDAQAATDWTACRDQRLPFFTDAPSPDHGLWRVSVPQTAAPLLAEWPQLIEWQGAQRWLWAPVVAVEAIRTAARGAGGHAQLFRAPASGDAGEPRADVPSPALRAVMRRLREAFDPHGVFQAPALF